MSRVGGGELRVDKAVSSTTSVWDTTNPLAVSMSFGTYRVSANQTFKKKVAIRNYSSTSRTYAIGNTYRDAPNTTGFTLSFPSSVVVPPNSSASITVSATVTAASLPAWTLNGGANGGSGELLNTVEYAGYLTFTDPNDTVHLPWHILPHKSANVQVGASLALSGNVTSLAITNLSAPIAGPVDVFSLTGTGVQFPPSALAAVGSDHAVINLQSAGVRLVCLSACTTAPVYGVQFAVTTFGQRSHPDVPAEFDVYIDSNNDGTYEFDVFNGDIGSICRRRYCRHLLWPVCLHHRRPRLRERHSDGPAERPGFYQRQRGGQHPVYLRGLCVRQLLHQQPYRSDYRDAVRA
jgi:hypothetical protein